MNKISNLSTEELEKKLTQKEKKLLDNWYKELSINAGAQKISQHKAFVLQLRDTLGKSLDKITRDDLIIFWNLLKESDYSWNTQCMKRKYIKRFIRFQYPDQSDKMLKELKAGEFKPSEKHSKENNLKPEELEKMLRTAQTLRDKTMLILLYESASRPEELLKLKWKDIKMDSEPTTVKLYSSKTERTRELPIKESVIHLKRWKQEWSYPDVSEDDLLFPGANRERILTTASLNNVINKTASRAGIKRNLTAYDFRHTRLTDIYNQGVRGYDHNLFAGHKKGSKQQATYVKTDEEEMFKAMLENVYSIEEISPEKREKLEETIKKQEKRINELEKGIGTMVASLVADAFEKGSKKK